MVLADHVDIILPFEREGKSLSFILKEVQKVEPSVTYSALRRFLLKWHSLAPNDKRPYIPRTFSADFDIICREIHRCYSVNSSVTVTEIRNRLKNLHDIDISDSQLRRMRKRLGYSKTTTRYCQMISEENKLKRLEFCMAMLDQKEIFADCIFTDESTVELNNCSKFCYTKKGNFSARLRCRPKHPAKIHIWGGISMRGATRLAILPGSTRINSEIYCNILKNCYLNFADAAYNGFSRLVHDNAPAHKSVYTSKKLKEWRVKALVWPPESPDLNPIELVWGNLKSFIRKSSVRNMASLKYAIKLFWKSLTPEKCKKYVQGIQWRLRKVADANGGNIEERK